MGLYNPYQDPLSDVPLLGECVPTRDAWISSGLTVVSGSVNLSYFTAARSEPITTLTTATHTTAAAATPTICRVGVYQVAASGDLTLIASSVNDTAMWSAASTSYAKALSATFDKVAGQRYATAALCVTAAATPQFVGHNTVTATAATLLHVAPLLRGRFAAQTDLPATISGGSVIASQPRIGFRLS